MYSQPWFHIINKETKKKSISEIQEIIDKELGITTSIRDQYEEKQLCNNLRDLEIDKQICSIRVADKLDDALYPDPTETLLIRQSKYRLSYSEKLEIMKKLRSNLYTKVEIWRRWNISMSTINRISREFEADKIPHYAETRILYWKLAESKRIQKLINDYLMTQDEPFTSKSIQTMIWHELKIQIPLHIIWKILKLNNRQSWKRIPSRVLKWDFELMKHQKLLFWIKFTKWLSHLKCILNTDESIFSRSTKVLYSWGMRGVKQPFKNIQFSGLLSIMSTISITGLSYNFIKEGTIKAHDFVEYINQMIEIMKSSWDIRNEEIGLILDNCAVHSAKETLKYMKEAKINVCFIPLYCPELAPIEKYFSILKQRVLNKGISNPINLNSSNGKELIEQWTQEMKESDIKSLWNHYFDEIILILQSSYKKD